MGMIERAMMAGMLLGCVVGAGALAETAGMSGMSGMAGSDGNETQIVMKSGQGLPVDVGGKKMVSYYQQQGQACQLTIVLSESQMGGMMAGGSEGPHGTRIVTEVSQGKSLRIDGDLNRAAEFACGPEGRKMNAHIYTREAYPGKSAGK